MMMRPMRRVEQARVAEDQVDRHQHADGRHHLGREHPHQDVLGALGRREGHRPGGRDGDQQRHSVEPSDRITEFRKKLEIVALRLHDAVALDRPLKDRMMLKPVDGLGLGLEEVMIIQRIGKKISEATSQASDV
jgi:hypothetical protein